MRQYFDFSSLIQDYENEFTVIVPGSTSYDDKGELVVTGSKEVTMKGAIIGFRESKIYRSEGHITSKDKHLFMLEPIDKALIGSQVVFREQKYSLTAETENAEFTGVYSYVLRWCSAVDSV